MSWAEIKKSVNSTLGTSGAMPLDKIVKQEANNLKNGLKNGTLIPQKSEMLTDDWQDVELEFNGNEDYWSYRINHLDSGLYVARISADRYNTPSDETPPYVFLLYVEPDEETNATIYIEGDWGYYLEYDSNLSSAYFDYDVINAYYQSYGSYGKAYLNNFKVKKII